MTFNEQSNAKKRQKIFTYLYFSSHIHVNITELQKLHLEMALTLRKYEIFYNIKFTIFEDGRLIPEQARWKIHRLPKAR